MNCRLFSFFSDLSFLILFCNYFDSLNRFCPFSGSLVDFYSHTSGCLSRMAPLEAAQDHRSFNLPENENACTFCGAEVASREGMESHILFKHLKAALTCSPCGLKLKNKSNSLKHIAEKHKDAEPSSCISIQVGRYQYFYFFEIFFLVWPLLVPLPGEGILVPHGHCSYRTDGGINTFTFNTWE